MVQNTPSNWKSPHPEFLSGSRRAHRFLAVLLGQGHPRALRALLDLHGPLLCRAVEALGVHRAAVGGRDAGPRRPGRDAHPRHPRLPRDRGRGLAEEVRPCGDLPRPLRQPDRQPRHQAQRLDPAGRLSGRADQGDARHRGPPLLRAFRHRHRRHRARARHQRPGRRRPPGRLLDHPAARQEPVPEQRAHHRAQGQRGLPRGLAGMAPDQERDPQALSRPRLYGRRHLRRRRRRRTSTSTNRRAT